MNKLNLYIHTVKYLKTEQVFARILAKIGITSRLKTKVLKHNVSDLHGVFIPELDYDPVFLARFNPNEIILGKVTFLHDSCTFNWQDSWEISNKTPLWNFNLHYFEFLLPLLHAYEESCDNQYLDKAKESIAGWIMNNPVAHGAIGWSPYTISLRLTNWLSFYARVEKSLDPEFIYSFKQSFFEQYQYLTKHLEKHLLGNHYFENLKTIALCAIALQDDIVLKEALSLLLLECDEQILGDGMHFELSPMYHKIILEDLLRVVISLKYSGHEHSMFIEYIQRMLNVAHFFENGLQRIPLFNDAGCNVAKSLSALEFAAYNWLHMKPKWIDSLMTAGFYKMERHISSDIKWTLFVDAGRPGADYIPGHAHNDAMSFELFMNGTPVIVNCGTYAYQTDKRSFFRSTSAHNTVKSDGIEQSECWGEFRLAKRSNTKVVDRTDNSISMLMRDQNGCCISRILSITDHEIIIRDMAKGHMLEAWIHGIPSSFITGVANKTELTQNYAPDFGKLQKITTTKLHNQNEIYCRINLDKITKLLGEE